MSHSHNIKEHYETSYDDRVTIYSFIHTGYRPKDIRKQVPYIFKSTLYRLYSQ